MTGTENSHKPIKIKKESIEKNMKLGNSIYITSICVFLFSKIFAEDRISTSPLINLEKIKPSFDLNDSSDTQTSGKNLKKEKNIKY